MLRLDGLEDRSVPSVYTVTNLHDDGAGSLRRAIQTANANPGADSIKFAPGLHGTITLTSGELDVTDDLTITGPGANLLTVSGNDASRVLDVSGGATGVTIRNLTVAAGLADNPTVTGPLGQAALGGGILVDGASLVLSHVTLADNLATGFIGGGGGVAAVTGAALTVDGCTVTGNRAAGTSVDSPGGGVLADGGSALTVRGSIFTGNRAIDGGAIAVWGGSQASVTASTFANNLARGNDGTLTTEPTTSDNGGAIFVAAQSAVGNPGNTNVSMTTCAFTANMARGGDGAPSGDAGQGAGGAIGIQGGPTTADIPVVDIRLSTFINNQAMGGNGGAGTDGGAGGVGQGGAVSQANATLTLEDSTFVGNQATGGVGGSAGPGGNGGPGGPGRAGAFVHTVAGVNGANFHPVSTVTDVIMTGNWAVGGMGGSAGDGGTGGNGGPGQGGAIRALLGTFNLSDSLLAANRAIGGAGGAAGVGGVGGSGGNGQGGAFITSLGVTAVLTDTALLWNQAVGGVGAAGGNGGSGLGGGIFNPNGPPPPLGAPDLTLQSCRIEFNQATGGSAGVGGTDGVGIGGGVFNVGTFNFDATTVIDHNHASTSNDDIFP
jgi:hypothetical protein